MTTEDRAEIRQMLSDILSGYSEEMKGRFNVIHANLIQIKDQTTKTNGRVNIVEDEIKELKIMDFNHSDNWPHSEKIANLEKSDISRKAIFRFVSIIWAGTLGFLTIPKLLFGS